MKTFRQLFEVYYTDQDKDDKDSIVTKTNHVNPKTVKEGEFGESHQVSSMDSGHHIYTNIKSQHNHNKHYFAFNSKTKQVDMHVSGMEKGKNFHIDQLSGREGSKLKAHDFYHHLITHHNKELVSISQSEGAKKVWARLKEKGIKVHTDKNGDMRGTQ